MSWIDRESAAYISAGYHCKHIDWDFLGYLCEKAFGGTDNAECTSYIRSAGRKNQQG